MTARPLHLIPRPALVALLALALAVVGLTAPPAAAEDPPNLVPNGDFSEGTEYWWGLDDAAIADGEACFTGPRGDIGNWAMQEVVEGTSYVLSFTARASAATSLGARVQPDGAGADDYDLHEVVELVADAEMHSFTFQAGPYSDAVGTPSNRLIFETGALAGGTTVCLSEISITPVAELLANPDFDGLAPWWTAGFSLAEEAGRMCGTVPASANPWDVILGQDGVEIEEGRAYSISLTASASPETTIRLVVQLTDGSHTPAYDATPLLRADGQTFEASFVSGHTHDTQFMLQLGGNSGFELCIDRASMTTGGTVEPYQPETGPRVRVNQHGYLPLGPKNATLVTDETTAVDWELHDGDGAVVASGTSVPRGMDPSADLNVHTIDFSGFTGVGGGFTLVADGEASYPFSISATLYDQLRKDALGIYYSQRSGIEIDDAIKPGYGRPAGHVSAFGGSDVNQGDLDVPCLPNEGAVNHEGAPQRGGFDHYGPEGWTCPADYALDVTGGWYDAGDHGKYVVNSGISVWQLLSTYERNQHAAIADRQALGDDTLRIPEAGSGNPDILDEVRWNLEWMLKMQVPAGTQMGIGGETIDAGGLVHHKLHDIAWTGLNTFPHEDPMPRYVHRPSTAATLNLAAAAAHGARLYDEFDQAFADELLEAARTAWAAAKAHPAIYAPNTNDLDNNPGGGPYDDDDVSDEFYWAAAQLYLTTGEQAFLDDVLASPHHTGDAFTGHYAFDWQHVAAAARLDLATVPSALPDRDRVIDSVLAGADHYLAIQAGEPFGHPYGPERYEWGSTHHVIQNAVVIAVAYDLSADRKYLDGALEAIDYVFGRNALNNSYVTGYGTVFSENMHSRWYAHSLTDRMPRPPDGKLAGGANSGIQDPVAQRLLQGCAPQLCYIDHIDSWSTNETTINWNAALAWWASFAADMGDGDPQWPAAEVTRLAGRTRIHTAVEISKSRFADGGAPTVLLARADKYPDALTGAPLAVAEDAPILLTLPGALHEVTAAELQRLGATRVVLLGGRAALSDDVADALAEAGLDVDRIDGANRFDTAAKIAERLGASAPVAVVAEGGHPDPGRGWPDALAAAPLAAAAGQPILLVSHGTLPGETAAALEQLGTTATVVAGGSAAVSDEVVAALAAAGHGPERVFGRNRYETSRALFDRAVADGADPDQLWLATGRNWPDALVGGPAVAASGGALLLVDPIDLDSSPSTRAVLTERGPRIASVTLLGGTGAISAEVEQQVRALLR